MVRVMQRIKVLIIQEDLKNYRDPIYSIIAESVDLTVAYTVSTEFQESSYPVIKLPYYRLGKIIWHKGLYKLLRKYDVVIYPPHLKMIKLTMSPFFLNKPKFVPWSIGLHVSYNRQYDLGRAPAFIDYFYEFLQDHADARLFYTKDVVEYWKKHKKLDESKCFVAHNTVKVENSKSPYPYDKKDSFLFVGTLYKQKGLGELLEAYAMAYARNNDLPNLEVIGNGPERLTLGKLAKDLGIIDKIRFEGPIYDENILSEFFNKAILCISPKQAGLSVLKSFGYGVPFVTRHDAITGGERNNIIDGYNGLYYDSINQLSDILIDSTTNIKKYSSLSLNAYDYYCKNATPENMAQGVIDAIKYVLSN